MDIDAAARLVYNKNWETEGRHFAFQIRKYLLNSRKRTLPNDLKHGDIYSGKIEIPKATSSFLGHIICTPGPRRSSLRKSELHKI